MKTQSAWQLFQYWNRLRAGSPAPRRTQIEPSDIRESLSDTFILESQSHNDEMCFRLAGTAISNFFGRQLRGTPVRAMFQDQHRPVVSRLMRNCTHDGAVIVLGLDASTRNGRQALLEIIMLPLQDEAQGHRILGCLAPHQRQFWHGLEPVSNIELHSIRVLDPEREPLFLANRPAVELSPAIVPTEQQLHLGGANPHKNGAQLLVIQGGKSAQLQSSITKH